jgi:septum formation protein
MGLEFRVMPSAVPEVHHPELTAREIAPINAYRKARAVAKRYPDALVLGADTLVYLDTIRFGKPATRAEALDMLRRLQGRTHEVVTAICLLHLREHRQRLFSEITAVTFRRLRDSDLNRYLDRVDPLDKAGAYAIQEEGDLIVDRISGSYSNVVGLPVEALEETLRAWPEFPGAR